MTGITILPARDVSPPALCAAIDAGFSDDQIPTDLTPDAFVAMMVQRGYGATLSKVTVPNRGMAAIWLAGIRGRAAYLELCGAEPIEGQFERIMPLHPRP